MISPSPASEEAVAASRFLRGVLWVDVWGSAAFGLLLLVAAGPVGKFADVAFGVPLGIGLVVMAWVAMVTSVVRRVPLAIGAASFVVLGNLAGVAVIVVVLVAFPDALSTGAEWALGFIGLGMLDLAVLEWIGMRRAR